VDRQPHAFTECGAAMLSSVLGSAHAVAVSIEIMRTFVRVRALAATHADLAKRLAKIEDKTEVITMQHGTFSRNTRNQLKQVFDAQRGLMVPPDPPKRPIGLGQLLAKQSIGALAGASLPRAVRVAEVDLGRRCVG
jgi:hypothetical protein